MSEAASGRLFDGLDDAGEQPTLLPWRELAHGATPVVALERPIPGIARCLVAPVPLLWLPVAARPAHHASRQVRCLAVDDDGRLAAPLLPFNGDAEALLAALRAHLRSAYNGPGARDGLAMTDSATALVEPTFWRLWGAAGPAQPYLVAGQWAERMAQHWVPLAAGHQRHVLRFLHKLAERLRAGVDWVLAGLPAALRTVIPERPELSWTLAHQVLALADRHGGQARRFADQALRCEPLPTLRWIAAGGPLAQALFDGRSVPRELCRLARIGTASARHVARQAFAVPDLPLPTWRLVLAAVDRLPPNRRPCGPRQWRELAAVVESLMPWLATDDEPGRRAVVEAVVAVARVLALGAAPRRADVPEWLAAFADLDSTEDLAWLVFSFFRRLTARQSPFRLPAADDDAARAEAGEAAAALAAALGKASARQFCDLWLGLLPELPPMAAGKLNLRLLRSIVEVQGVGRALRNCLRDAEHVLGYLVKQTAFVAVEGAAGEPLGLVGLRLQRCGSRLLREMGQAEGLLGAPLPEGIAQVADVHFERMARDAARFEPFVRVAEALVARADEDAARQSEG